jgi:hypothetical protein
MRRVRASLDMMSVAVLGGQSIRRTGRVGGCWFHIQLRKLMMQLVTVNSEHSS